MHRLMIKTHNKTGLKYLCVTIKKNWNEYPGSGTYWTKHLNKHGHDFNTELLYESENILDFSAYCIVVSSELNIVLSDEFANYIPEDGGLYSAENFKQFWLYASEDLKKDIFDRRKNTLLETYKENGMSESTRLKISKSHIENWRSLSIDERRELTFAWREKSREYFRNKDTEAYASTIKKCSEHMRNIWANTTEEEYARKCKAISDGRYAMSEEDKNLRAQRVSDSFKISESWKEYIARQKITRLGSGNPAAKNTKWMGVIYSKKDFKKLCLINKISTQDVSREIETNPECEYLYDPKYSKQYKEIECPHCNKKSASNKSPGAFKRWHLDNCKEKK